MVHGNVGRASNRADEERREQVRWRRNIWRPTTTSKCRAKPCGVGCWPTVCGAAAASGTAPYAAPTPRSLRRADSTGRFASRLAGATRPERLPDELRQRCDRLGPVPFFGARNHLGGGRFIGSVGASTRHSASVVLRLEKRLQAQADVARSDGRHRARDTVRTHVPGSWTFASSPLRRRKPKAGWSAITGRIKIA